MGFRQWIRNKSTLKKKRELFYVDVHATLTAAWLYLVEF